MLKFLGIVLFAYALVVVTVWIWQRHFMYSPDTSRPHVADAQLLDLREVSLETNDGLRLNSWFFPAKPGFLTLVYFQGNAGHYGDRLDVVNS